MVFGLLVFRYSPDQRFTLFFLNKACADSAIIFIGISFLLGPLCKILPFLGKYISLRRYFGLIGFGAVVVHIVLSLVQFTSRFPITWYIEHVWGVIAAVIATGIFFVLAITSSKKAFMSLGAKKWKTVQRIGYLALILALVHITVAAFSRWQQFFAGKVDMPNSFAVVVFGSIVIIARIAAYIVDKQAVQKKEEEILPEVHHGL